ALDIVLERVEACGGEDARLPHAAAENLARASCLRNEIGVAEQNGAGRSPQALRQARRDRVQSRAQVLDARSQMDRRVEDAGTVEVGGEAALLRQVQRARQVIPAEGTPPDGVFEGQKPGPREMRVVGLDSGLD